MHWGTFNQDNYTTVGGDGGCRVSEVRAGTTSPMPDPKGFKLQCLLEIHPLHKALISNFQNISTLRVKNYRYTIEISQQMVSNFPIHFCFFVFIHFRPSLLIIIAGVDLLFRHEPELPVCWTQDFNLSAPPPPPLISPAV